MSSYTHERKTDETKLERLEMLRKGIHSLKENSKIEFAEISGNFVDDLDNVIRVARKNHKAPIVTVDMMLFAKYLYNEISDIFNSQKNKNLMLNSNYTATKNYRIFKDIDTM